MARNGSTSRPRRKQAQFIAWLKRNKAGKRYDICKKKLRHLGLDADVLESFPEDTVLVQRQYGEEFVCLVDRSWADEFAKECNVEVMHHGHYMKMKNDLL